MQTNSPNGPPGKSGAQTYRDLVVWQKAMDLCVDCYRFTANLPTEERYGLASQLRRASVSVPSNIAEGFGRESRGAFAQYLRISRGSLKELETQLLICQRVGLASSTDVAKIMAIADEMSKMLRALLRSLEA